MGILRVGDKVLVSYEWLRWLTAEVTRIDETGFQARVVNGGPVWWVHYANVGQAWRML